MTKNEDKICTIKRTHFILYQTVGREKECYTTISKKMYKNFICCFSFILPYYNSIPSNLRDQLTKFLQINQGYEWYSFLPYLCTFKNKKC
jgi:hypothetical protein